MSSRTIKIVTINILRDLSKWKQRSPLLLDGLNSAQADIIALQEVALREDNATWLAEQLSQRSPEARPYQRYLSPKTGPDPDEGIAILTRLEVEKFETIDLGSQNRVAQFLKVNTGLQSLVIANIHLFWFPGNSKARLEQVDRLFRRLDVFSQGMEVVLCGDFNSPPHSPTIKKVEQRLVSAYKKWNGGEPLYTAPTSLPVSRPFQVITLFRFLISNWRQLRNIKLERRSTLDYIFINAQLTVEECRLILNQPAPGRPRLYPSDHLGLYAVINVRDPNQKQGGK